jgi:hypothetical protein
MGSAVVAAVTVGTGDRHLLALHRFLLHRFLLLRILHLLHRVLHRAPLTVHQLLRLLHRVLLCRLLLHLRPPALHLLLRLRLLHRASRRHPLLRAWRPRRRRAWCPRELTRITSLGSTGLDKGLGTGSAVMVAVVGTGVMLVVMENGHRHPLTLRRLPAWYRRRLPVCRLRRLPAWYPRRLPAWCPRRRRAWCRR